MMMPGRIKDKLRAGAAQRPPRILINLREKNVRYFGKILLTLKHQLLITLLTLKFKCYE